MPKDFRANVEFNNGVLISGSLTASANTSNFGTVVAGSSVRINGATESNPLVVGVSSSAAIRFLSASATPAAAIEATDLSGASYQNMQLTANTLVLRGVTGNTIYTGLTIDSVGNTLLDKNLTASAGSVYLSSNASIGTIPIVGTTTSQALTNKTINGSSNTLSNIPNSALTNSGVTIGSSSVALGNTLSTINGLTLASPSMTGTASAAALTMSGNLTASGGSAIFNRIGSNTASPAAPIHILKNVAAGPVFRFDGIATDTSTDNANGIGMYLTHNETGNRQFVIADTDSVSGIRVTGNYLDGYQNGSRVEMYLGTSTTGAHIGDLGNNLSTNKFSVSNYNDTASKVVAIFQGAVSQTGDLSRWADSAGTTLVSIGSSGNTTVGGNLTASVGIDIPKSAAPESGSTVGLSVGRTGNSIPAALTSDAGTIKFTTHSSSANAWISGRADGGINIYSQANTSSVSTNLVLSGNSMSSWVPFTFLEGIISASGFGGSTSFSATKQGAVFVGSTLTASNGLTTLGELTAASVSVSNNLTASAGNTYLGAASVNGNSITTNNIVRGMNHVPANSIETFSRTSAQTSLGTSPSATLFTFFTALETINASSISFFVGNAGASITFFRIGLYSVSNADQSSASLSLVARTASVTSTTSPYTNSTLATLAFSTTGGYPSSYTLNAGSRYAVGFLCRSATTQVGPVGLSLNQGALAALVPRINGASAGQTDLSTAYTASALTNSNLVPWFRIS